MWEIFIGSLILSLIHVAIPNHWIPLIAISKTEKWTVRESLSATVITGLAHTLSTLLIGVFVGLIGIKLANSYSLIMDYIAPSILLGIGVLYIFLDLKNHKHHHHHDHFEHTGISNRKKSKIAILTSLSLAMFLTPCIEIEAFYFQAGLIGWKGIFVVSTVYTLTTVVFMVVLVYAGLKGTQRLRFHILEHHEKLFTGIVLIALGVLAYIVKF